MPIPKAVARFNRHVTNPLARLVAGWMSPFALVTHRGRRSGREYRTPVWSFRTGEGLVIPLMYGADSDWVHNVLAAGRCRVRTRGRTIEATDLRVVRGASGRELVPRAIRGPLRLMAVTEFLALSASPAERRSTV
jgi:deazaflavin-dependent oxidoreductase (nitroreductase family)